MQNVESPPSIDKRHHHAHIRQKNLPVDTIRLLKMKKFITMKAKSDFQYILQLLCIPSDCYQGLIYRIYTPVFQWTAPV